MYNRAPFLKLTKSSSALKSMQVVNEKMATQLRSQSEGYSSKWASVYVYYKPSKPVPTMSTHM
jgi:hypothetical protein